MSTKPLTDRTLQSLAGQPSKRIYVWDSKLSGFGARVEPSGNKSFVLKYRFRGQQRMNTLGKYPRMSLSEARSHAKAILGRVYEGTDPKHTELVASKTIIFEDLFQMYLARHVRVANRANTQKEVERTLRKDFVPRLGRQDVSEIRKADIVAVLDDIVARGAPGTANHAFSYIRHLFAWAVSRGVIEVSPCHGLSAPAPKKSRERVLTDHELAVIWKAAGGTEFPFGPIVRLLMLSGQRRGEVTAMRWDNLDLVEGIWTLPPEHTKNKREHLVPLTQSAIDILNQIPQLDDVLVFPARGSTTTVFSGFSKCKRRLDQKCNLPHWTLHDIRRSVATGLAKLEVQPHVIERTLNHVSGSFAGVAGTYNRFAYYDECRDGLERWSEHISSLDAKRGPPA